jgi:hypothetical protein
MTKDTTTITLPRIEGESARAFRARTEYVLMGADRSLDKTRQKLGKSAGYTRVLQEWSSRYGWQDSARAYDEQISYITVQEAADAYRSDLADYRKRYGDMGKALYGSAAKMLKKINASLDNGSIPLGPNAIVSVLNAAKTAADLEALALRVEHLLNNEPSSE